MLVYFQDKDDVMMEGGELILHPPSLDLRLLEKLRLYRAAQAQPHGRLPLRQAFLALGAGRALGDVPASLAVASGLAFQAVVVVGGLIAGALSHLAGRVQPAPLPR